mgnify:CR=1 FL=1
MYELLFLAGVVGLFWFWWDSIGVKEVARDYAKQACRQADVQLLDDTVAVSRIRLRRDSNGKLKFYRQYRFDFTPDGEQRFQGKMVFLGRIREQLDLGTYPYTQRL